MAYAQAPTMRAVDEECLKNRPHAFALGHASRFILRLARAERESMYSGVYILEYGTLS